MTMHAIGLTSLSNTAKDFRNDMSAILGGATTARPTGARSGVRPGTPVTTVSLVAFAGTVKPHSGIMDVQTSAVAGPYWYSVTANETFTVSAAHATLPRIDIVTVRINDNVEDSSGLETATVQYKAGTAGAVPVAPSPATTRELIIATIAVPASGGGNPVVSWVAPYSVAAGGRVFVRNVTERAALVAAYPATTENPVEVWRKDAGTGLERESTVDNVNWLTTFSGTPWTAYTPVLTGSGGNPTGYTAAGRYAVTGKTVTCAFKVVFGAGAGGGTYSISLPIAAQDTSGGGYVGGTIWLYSAGGVQMSVVAGIPASALTICTYYAATYGGALTGVGATTPWAWTTGNFIAGNITYEAA